MKKGKVVEGATKYKEDYCSHINKGQPGYTGEPIHYSYAKKANVDDDTHGIFCYTVEEGKALLKDDLDETAFNINMVMYISCI